MEHVQDGIGPRTAADLLHRGLVAVPPTPGEGLPVKVVAFRRQRVLRLARHRAPPVHHRAEHIEQKRLHHRRSSPPQPRRQTAFAPSCARKRRDDSGDRTRNALGCTRPAAAGEERGDASLHHRQRDLREPLRRRRHAGGVFRARAGAEMAGCRGGAGAGPGAARHRPGGRRGGDFRQGPCRAHRHGAHARGGGPGRLRHHAAGPPPRRHLRGRCRDAMSIGARQRRTSRTRAWCSRSATRWASWKRTCSPSGTASPASPVSTATRRWPVALISSTRCRSPSATRRPSGWLPWSAIWSGSNSCAPACSRASSRARPERWPRCTGAGLEVSDALMEELGLGRPAIAWHTARDTIAETTGLPRTGHRLARQDRDRRGAADGDRDGRGVRALHARPGWLLHHAAEAQSRLQRAYPGLRQAGPEPGRARHGLDGGRPRTLDRPLACRMGRAAGSLRAGLGRARPGAFPRRGPAGRSGGHAGQYGPDARADRLRSRDDGPCARARPAGGARPRL